MDDSKQIIKIQRANQSHSRRSTCFSQLANPANLKLICADYALFVLNKDLNTFFFASIVKLSNDVVHFQMPYHLCLGKFDGKIMLAEMFFLAAGSQLPLSCHPAVSQLSLSCLSAVYQLSPNCL